MTTTPKMVDARQLGDLIGLPYKTIAHLSALSPAPFTSMRLSDRVLMVHAEEFKAFLVERTRLAGDL